MRHAPWDLEMEKVGADLVTDWRLSDTLSRRGALSDAWHNICAISDARCDYAEYADWWENSPHGRALLQAKRARLRSSQK